MDSRDVGSGSWENANTPTAKRISLLIAQLDLNEKISQLGSSSPAISRLGIHAFNWWSGENLPTAYLMCHCWFPLSCLVAHIRRASYSPFHLLILESIKKPSFLVATGVNREIVLKPCLSSLCCSSRNSRWYTVVFAVLILLQNFDNSMLNLFSFFEQSAFMVHLRPTPAGGVEPYSRNQSHWLQHLTQGCCMRLLK